MATMSEGIVIAIVLGVTVGLLLLGWCIHYIFVTLYEDELKDQEKDSSRTPRFNIENPAYQYTPQHTSGLTYYDTPAPKSPMYLPSPYMDPMPNVSRVSQQQVVPTTPKSQDMKAGKRFTRRKTVAALEFAPSSTLEMLAQLDRKILRESNPKLESEQDAWGGDSESVGELRKQEEEARKQRLASEEEANKQREAAEEEERHAREIEEERLAAEKAEREKAEQEQREQEERERQEQEERERQEQEEREQEERKKQEAEEAKKRAEEEKAEAERKIRESADKEKRALEQDMLLGEGLVARRRASNLWK